MISTMREYLGGLKLVLLFVILAFVGTSVVYFGADALSRKGVGDHSVATVNGEDIPVERGDLPDAATFVRHVPHLSFVSGEDDVAFLRARHAQLSSSKLFAEMERADDESGRAP